MRIGPKQAQQKQPIRVTFRKEQKKKAPKLTALQLKAVLGLLEPALARLGGPHAKGNHTLAGGIAKLQDQFSRLSAKELLKLTHGDLFEGRK